MLAGAFLASIILTHTAGTGVGKGGGAEFVLQHAKRCCIQGQSKSSARFFFL